MSDEPRVSLADIVDDSRTTITFNHVVLQPGECPLVDCAQETISLGRISMFHLWDRYYQAIEMTRDGVTKVVFSDVTDVAG